MHPSTFVNSKIEINLLVAVIIHLNPTYIQNLYVLNTKPYEKLYGKVLILKWQFLHLKKYLWQIVIPLGIYYKFVWNKHLHHGTETASLVRKDLVIK